MTLNIPKAYDLIAADSTGTSDPKVKAYFFGQEKETFYVKETLCPVNLLNAFG